MYVASEWLSSQCLCPMLFNHLAPPHPPRKKNIRSTSSFVERFLEFHVLFAIPPLLPDRQKKRSVATKRQLGLKRCSSQWWVVCNLKRTFQQDMCGRTVRRWFWPRHVARGAPMQPTNNSDHLDDYIIHRGIRLYHNLIIQMPHKPNEFANLSNS